VQRRRVAIVFLALAGVGTFPLHRVFNRIAIVAFLTLTCVVLRRQGMPIATMGLTAALMFAVGVRSLRRALSADL
jgi:hypothetical protein